MASARSAGRAAAAAYAFRTGDQVALGRLGLDFAELTALGDPFEITRRIVEAACGRPDSTIEDHEQRLVAADVAEWVLTENIDGQAPAPEEIVRHTIALIIADTVLSETGELLNNSAHAGIAEQEIRDAAEALAARENLSADGVSETQFAEAIERGTASHRRGWRLMPPFRLRLSTPASATTEEARSSFYWLAEGPSSFTHGLGPNLGSLGPVPALSVDLVRIAATVYAADRSVNRTARGSDWNRRDLDLIVPVSDASAWSARADDLAAVIEFLTGDRWALSFNEDAAPPEPAALRTVAPARVVLLSGGADSAIGALASRAALGDDEEHVLLSHFSASTLAPIQRTVAQQVATLLPGPGQQHRQIHLARNQKRLDGTRYPTEPSSRSRSLLFLALGLAIASVDAVPLWIPENGFASINPPLGPERRGSLSTRTTHPAFLGGLSSVLTTVGAHGLIENRFADRTKGEMFRHAAEVVGDNAAAALLSSTNSCAHTGQRAFGVSPATACGVCFGCVVRRASFHAAGLTDSTAYISAGGNAKLQDWLDANSVEPAVRSFVRRGVRQRDLIAFGLPPTYPIAQALDLCRRGLAELSGLLG